MRSSGSENCHAERSKRIIWTLTDLNPPESQSKPRVVGAAARQPEPALLTPVIVIRSIGKVTFAGAAGGSVVLVGLKNPPMVFPYFSIGSSFSTDLSAYISLTSVEMPKRSTQSGAGNVIRKAGLLERFHIARHDLGMDSCVIVSARYRNVSDGVLEKPMLFTALAKVILRHAPLMVQMSADHRSFLRLDEINLSQAVEFIGTDVQLQDHFESQLRRGFELNVNLPLWRLSVMPNNTIVFSCFHGIGDGMSGVAFHHTLLDTLNSVEQPAITYAEVLAVPQDTMLVPNVEKLVNVSPSFTMWCHEVWQTSAPVSLQPHSSAWTGNRVVKVPNLDMRARLLRFSPQDTGRMLELCRSHGTTLTGLLGAIAIPVLSRVLASDPSTRKLKTISFGTAISIRRFIDVLKDDTMGNFVSVQETFPRIIRSGSDCAPSSGWLDGFTWEEATRYSSGLHKNLRESVGRVGMLKWLFGQIDEYYKLQQGKKRLHGLEISNLGQLRIPVQGFVDDPSHIWTIEEMDFAQGDGTCGGAIKLNVIGAPSGALGIGVTWARESVPDPLADSFAAGLSDAIGELISSSAGTSKD
ncbi:hypothetical protein OBBRIDRAFT_825294 [Obba rivulosa]|uniref:Alcohol acetyltransferase n=1 Tax=Obba rivulosa TaxID=1052685 RepID=A0A8E2DKH7_9APHY|nr:hypothetical protein OBBRIDRAFT_825294 [Obba rivulosa]